MTFIQNLKLSVPSKVVLIGASTGGPGQLEKIIKSIPKLNRTSIIIAQHMAIGFMHSFSKRLQEYNINDISVAKNDTYLQSSNIYLCCGKTTISKNNFGLIFSQEPSSKNSFNPDINKLFNSFTPFTKDIEILSVILTGIGDDGVEGCKALGLNGCVCLTESEKSAIVDGMPSRARKEVQDIRVLNIDEIAEVIREFCN